MQGKLKKLTESWKKISLNFCSKFFYKIVSCHSKIIIIPVTKRYSYEVFINYDFYDIIMHGW